MATDPVKALEAMQGAGRAAELRRLGVASRTLARAVAEGLIARPSAGLYVLPGASSDVIAARLWNGRIGCVSALERGGVALLRKPSMPHIVVPRNRPVSRAAETRPRVAQIHRVDAQGAGLVVPVGVALKHAQTCLSPIEHLVAVDSAMASGVIVANDLTAERVSALSRMSWLRLEVDPQCGSPLETVGRQVLKAAGLRVHTQVAFVDVGRVDFVVEGRVVVELDGWAFHSERGQIARDHQRDRTLLARGVPTIRFSYRDVVNAPLLFASQVCATVGKEPHPQLFDRLRALGVLQ